MIGTEFLNDQDVLFEAVAENEKTVFLVEKYTDDEGFPAYNYNNIQAFSKEAPEYPLETIVDYTTA